jgi:prevent-host-death family protein
MWKWSFIMQTWQMQTAKARFSELMKQAADNGPQEITLHGRPVAVVISREEFDRLSGGAASLVEFMQQSPLYDQEDIEFERDQSLPREVAL